MKIFLKNSLLLNCKTTEIGYPDIVLRAFEVEILSQIVLNTKNRKLFIQ